MQTVHIIVFLFFGKLRLTPAQDLLALEELHERPTTLTSSFVIMTDWFRSLTSIIEIRITPRPNVIGYETSKLITSDTDLERGNAQRERWKIATTC